jgi:ribosomal protein L33
MKKIIYNGQYENEGHSVSFLVCEDDTVLISERYISTGNVRTNERKVKLSKAIEFQNSLKKYGYDKIS